MTRLEAPMRKFCSALSSLIAVSLACGILGLFCGAGEAGPDDKDKPKERPFKYDAWCVFSDLMPDRPYIPPNAPIDPNDEHSRPGLDKLGGFGRRGQWAHLIVDLKNRTDPKDKTVYEGFSSIVLNHFKPDDAQQTTYATTYRQAFQVAPQTEKPYHFSIFCPENGWNEHITVEIATTSGHVFYRDIKIHDLDQRNEQLIVVVSDQPGSFKYLGPRQKNKDEPDLAGASEEAGRQVASVSPGELPTRWHDLALASLIVIDGPPAGGLSPEQWDAIKAYAQSGGRVLIMAGKDPNRLKGAIEDLAGIVVRNSAELPSLDQFDSKFPLSDEKNKELRVPVIEVTAPGAGIVKRNSKTQIVEYSAKSYGAGMVAFIPFSLSDRMFENWPERYQIPLKLVRSEKNLFSIDLNDDSDTAPPNSPFVPNYQRGEKQTALASLRNTLDTSFDNDTPVVIQSPRTVLWFLLAYLVCAVPFNYAIFFLLRRREAAWLMAPVWALIFSIAVYYYGYSGATGFVTVNEVCVIEAGSGQGTGIGRTFMGVYTPRRNDYQIEFPPLKLGGDARYDTEAAPGHLVNTEFMKSRELEYPSMRVREAGGSLKIEEILFQTRSTRRFEIQHRVWLNGGLDLKIASGQGDNETQPAIKMTNNTGRTLFNPIFVKNGRYIDLARGTKQSEFANGQEMDSTAMAVEWHAIDDKMVENFTARFDRVGGGKHTAVRAIAAATYLKNHMKQYTAGVFVAWADGASLPVKIGATGDKTEEPNLDGITLLVVPATASNRGGRAISLKKNPPKAFYATAYSPEDRSSGEWKPCAKDSITIKTPDDQNKKCVYLRLQFDREYGQYVYENKAAQLTFSLVNRSPRGSAPFNGDLKIFARIDSAKDKTDRFKLLEEPAIAGLAPSSVNKLKPAKFQFTGTELFTGSSIILKIQPQPDEGAVLPENLVLEGVDLQLVDK